MEKLFIADDEEEFRDILKEFFEEKGYSVVTAGNQKEAKEVIQRENPRVALLDIRMSSERDGLEILAWIKSQKLNIKTIMVTALENRDVVEEAQKLGADDYITKPLNLEYLEKIVLEKINQLMTGK